MFGEARALLWRENRILELSQALRNIAVCVNFKALSNAPKSDSLLRSATVLKAPRI